MEGVVITAACWKVDEPRRPSRFAGSATQGATRQADFQPAVCKSDDRQRLWRGLIATLVLSFVMFLVVLIHIWRECCSADQIPPRALRMPYRGRAADAAAATAAEGSDTPLGSFTSLQHLAPLAPPNVETTGFELGGPGWIEDRTHNVEGGRRKPLLDAEAIEAQLKRLTAGIRLDPSPPPRSFDNGAVRVRGPFHLLRLHGTGCSGYLAARPLEASVNVTVVLSDGASPGAVAGDSANQGVIAAVDYVVTYVNPFHLEPSEGDPQRVRDWNELYWNLRSIFHNGRLCVYKDQPERCLLGRIHLVVASRAHVPTWLSRRLAGPDANGTARVELRFREFLRAHVNVVEHKDMFPADTPYREAYNSNVIELNLHRIPGLSPFYLYFNNDMFLGRELRLQDLFTPVSLTGMELNCNLLPITWYERDPFFRRPYAEPPLLNPMQLNDDIMVGMQEYNVELLKAAPRLRWRGQWTGYQELPLLHYAHVPILYDRAMVASLLDEGEVRFAAKETMQHPNVRQPRDVWVPFLYINAKHLAVWATSGATQARLFQATEGDAYHFAMLTGTAAMQSLYLQLRRYEEGTERPPLFVTFNDDFPRVFPSRAADPSILFDPATGAPHCGDVAAAVQAAEGQVPLHQPGRGRHVRAIWTLFHMHELYCRWGSLWERN